MNTVNNLKEEMMKVTIPQNLDASVNDALSKGKRLVLFKKLKRSCVGVAASLALLFGLTNVTPVISNATGELPLVGQFIKVITIKNWYAQEENATISLNVPQLKGIGNDTLEAELNAKYSKEYETLFNDFAKELPELKLADAHKSIDARFSVVTDTERVFSLGRSMTLIQGSGAVSVAYDTVDPKLGKLIQLDDLFIDDSYLNVISDTIKAQMKAQMSADASKVYFVDDFKGITKDQPFYITEDGQLKISFDEYSVAPGSMGVVEFEIPYETLKDILVNQTYIHD